MNKSLMKMEIELGILRNQNMHNEADELQIEIGIQKAELIQRNLNPNSFVLSGMNKPIKPMDNEHELYLVRFREGTRVGFDLLDGTLPVRWRANSFIPVVGIEIKKDQAEKVLEKVKTMSSCIKLQKTHLFHEYSFFEI